MGFYQKLELIQNKKIIIGIVSVFAIQFLIMISIYGDNWSVEVPLGLPITSEYFITNNYPYELIFRESDSHLHIFSRIPFLVSLFFDNFNTKNLLYISWGLLSGSIYLLYLILRRTNEQMIWLLIPLSALVYNPIQYFTFLWAHASFVYGIPFFSTILITYFLNKKELDKKSYFISLATGIISSFSLIGGTIVLVSGLFPLIHRKEKKKLVIWILSVVVVIITYLYAWSETNRVRIQVVPEKQIITFLKLIALPYTVKLDSLYTALGISMIILFIVSFILIKKQFKFNTLLPWMQMAFVGSCLAIMVTLGRGAVAYYYSTLTVLFAIGLMGFIGLILVFLRQPLQKKKILMVVFVVAIIVQVLLLVPSYYMGWKLANDFNNYETKRNSCYSLNPDNEICSFEQYYNLTKDDNFERLQIMNGFLKQKKGIFVDDSLNKKTFDDQIFYEKTLEKINNVKKGFGELNEVNNIKSSMIKEPLITISGWITDEDKMPVDYMYILSNNKPLIKISQFEVNQNEIGFSNYGIKSAWNVSFLSGYLENNCNNITMIGFKENTKIIIDDVIMLCKN